MRVAVLRSADRAGAFVTEIRNAGHTPVVCPLIDFEFPASTTPIDGSLSRWLAGEFDAAIFTSITTVRALKQRAFALDGLDASGESSPWKQPAGQLVAVGDPTRRALEAEGFTVDLMPAEEQSAQGILALLAQEPLRSADGSAARVFLPHANLADPALERGLQELGYEVEAVDAYLTVDAPADHARRITAPLKVASAGAGGVVLEESTQLEPQELAQQAREGGLDAVLLTSPSIARKFAELVGEIPASMQLVAIGKSTGAEIERLGLRLDGIAERPDAASMMAALTKDVKTKNS